MRENILSIFLIHIGTDFVCYIGTPKILGIATIWHANGDIKLRDTDVMSQETCIYLLV